MIQQYAKYLNDPVGFARDILRRTFTSQQVSAARSILTPPYRTLIPSGNEQGKTLLSAALAIWWHCTRAPGIVITTAPRMDSVRDLIWKEIRTLASSNNLALDFLPRACRIERAPNDFVVGMTATDATSFQGHHGPNMLFVFEEANGVPAQFWIAVETMFSPPGHAWVCIYNPTMTSGQDYIEYSRVQSAARRASGPDIATHAQSDSARSSESGVVNTDTSAADNLDSARTIDNRLSLDRIGSQPQGAAGGNVVQGNRAAPPWHVVRMSALDHPNIAAELRGEAPPVPHAMRLGKFERLLRSWSQLVSPSEKPRPTDVQWPPAWAEHYIRLTRQRSRWYRPGPIAEARLLGRYPSQGINSVWSDGDWIAATREGLDPIPIPLYALPEIGCFVAGTLIETERGSASIENIKKGDKVLTRCGYKQVKESFCTGVKPTWTLTCEDGGMLIGTGDHPVWDGNQWRRLDSLMSGDTVMTWKESSTMASSSAATRNLNGTGTDAIFSHDLTANRFLSIDTSGRRLTGRYRRDQSFITKTKIQPTTTSTIWNALPLRSIPGFTTYSPVSDILPVHGTRVDREGVGIRQWPNRGDHSLRSLASVKRAASNTRMYHQLRRDSAQARANRFLEDENDLMTRRENVWSAAESSNAANTTLLKLAPVRVVRNSPGRYEKVYNLTVEDCPEYFANGILVHNCDVARYGDDLSAIHIRIHLASVHAESANGWSIPETTGRLIQLADHYAHWYNLRMGELPQAKRRPSITGHDIPVKVEDDGVGGGVTDLLRERGYYAIPIKASSNAWAVGDYPNRRSELWFTTADMARVDEIDLSRLDPSRSEETGWPCSVDPDYLDELKRQLMAPTWEMDSRGRRVVERKEEMKARLGRSPDDADAFNIAYAPWVRGDALPGVGAGKMDPGAPEWDVPRGPRFQMGGVE